MSEFKGKRISLDLFGESHSEKIGITVSGFPRFKIDFDRLKEFTERRKAVREVYSTSRKEGDEPEFYGLDGDFIAGDFRAEIKNSDIKSKDYSSLYGKPRPSHADYAWFLKDGVLDFSGGGRFSARLSAPLCLAGGIAKQILESRGVFIEAFVSEIGGVKGRSYEDGELSAEEIVRSRSGFPSLTEKDKMKERIAAAKADGDSVGGAVEAIVFGLSGGVGNDYFDGLECDIARLIYAVPAVKCVEFGAGRKFASAIGSAVNDGLYYKDGKVRFYSNNAGGINGGISNGNAITLRATFRPTPSISKTQKTVDLIKKENAEINIVGRHDACVVPRAVPVIESMTAIAILDEIL